MNRPITTAEIRESFLTFFEAKGATRLPSSSLVPDDPSLLLTAAGMVQFKPVLLGVKRPEHVRATTAQKCVRTTDIDIIGTTGRHLSFFEMLGNFSFGDYFKREAIRWAWEYSTEILQLDPQRIYATAFRDDDEAVKLWLEETPLPAQRVLRFDEADNFWAAGPTGPCGPCAELFYDRGPGYGCDSPDCSVGCECDRFVEYWNLVFMQYDRDQHGNLAPLEKRSIDTGMGLERMAAILQDVPTNFDTDLMREIIASAETATGTAYSGAVSPTDSDVALRIIADHARSVAFLIADGVLPSNEGRGYVLRRLLRRAVLNGHKLGVETAFMQGLVENVIQLMSDHYLELSTHAELIAGIVSAEEDSFLQTLRKGLRYLEDEMARLSEDSSLEGSAAFKLHDTYGFPIDLTVEIAAQRGHGVDMQGFEAEMTQQKQRARAQLRDVSWTGFGNAYSDVLEEFGPSYFEGYHNDSLDSVILAIIDKDGNRIPSISVGQTGEIVLNYTPFYGEQGGQIGDTGVITSAHETADTASATFEVKDTQIVDGLIVHKGQMSSGKISTEESVTAQIDVMRRAFIARNHSATHLLHWALAEIVGGHVTQAGSYVSDQRMRFDFTHFERLTTDQLSRVEELVNQKIAENLPVRAFTTTMTEAQELGVTALFGEKYANYVRVVEVDNTCKELCGGTHVGRSGEIGIFKIASEESVGANLRRIEAVTSIAAYQLTRKSQDDLLQAASLLKTNPKDVNTKIENMLANQKKLKATVKNLQQNDTSEIDELLKDLIDTGNYKVVVAHPKPVPTADLRKMWDRLKQSGADAVILVTSDNQSNKAIYLSAANEKATSAGFHAGDAIKSIASELGGRGGGKPSMAQGGADITAPQRLAELVDTVRKDFS